MTSSCILGFQATRPAPWSHCLLYVGESQSISEANNSGLQTQQCPIGQVEVLAVEGLTPKER